MAGSGRPFAITNFTDTAVGFKRCCCIWWRLRERRI